MLQFRIYKNILMAYKKEDVCHMIVKKIFYKHKIRYMVLFMVLLTVNWFVVTSFVPLVEAANSLVGIEIFTNQQTSNTSGSTYESPLVFSSEKTSHDVDFIVTGDQLVDLEVLNGYKQVVLAIPDDLVGYVEPRAEAEIEVNVVLSEDAPVIGGVLTTVSDLVAALLTGVANITGYLGIPGIDDLVNDLVNVLDRLTNIGKLTYTAKIDNHGNYLVIDYQDGLVSAIISNLLGTIDRALELVDSIAGVLDDVLGNLGILGAALGLILRPIIEGVLNTVLSPLRLALEGLQDSLLHPSEELIDSLANASILSDTKVTFPTTIRDPGEELYGDANGIVAETFIMRIVQTEVIDLNLIKQAHNPTTVYLQGKKEESQLTLTVPDNLNFGQHTIQTTKPEIWVATETGEQTAPLTTGNLHLTDTSNQSKNWQIKVRQETNWGNNTNELTDAILYMYGGELVIDGFSKDSVVNGFSNGPIRLMTGEEKEVLSLNQTNQRGSIKLGIDKFALHVPENIEKKQGEYEATFIWTASDTP